MTTTAINCTPVEALDFYPNHLPGDLPDYRDQEAALEEHTRAFIATLRAKMSRWVGVRWEPQMRMVELWYQGKRVLAITEMNVLCFPAYSLQAVVDLAKKLHAKAPLTNDPVVLK